MKKTAFRFVSLMTALVVLLFGLPVSAYANSVSYTATVGEGFSHEFYRNDADTVNSATIVSGTAAGVGIAVIDNCAVSVTGTPSAAGTYELSVSIDTLNSGVLQYTISLTVQDAPPASTGIPVITKHPGGETVFETDSPVFIANADNATAYAWELLTADGTTIPCGNLAAAYAGLTVTGFDTNTLQLGNIPLALNGSKVRCCFVGTEQSVYSDYASITVRSAKEAKPVVTKNPTSEKVKEGGLCQFVARAKYAQYYDWELISPDGTYYEADAIEGIFEGIKVSGEYSDTLTLRNIPAELDGFRVRCKFFSASVTASEPAYLYVIPNQETTEATEETTAPAEEATEAATTEAPAEVDTTPTAPATEQTEAPAQTEAPVVEAPVPEENSGSTTSVPVVAVCASVVALAAIAAYVILKMKKR